MKVCFNDTTAEGGGKKTCRMGTSSAVEEREIRRVPYLQLRLKVKRARDDCCEECGDRCHQGINFKGK